MIITDRAKQRFYNNIDALSGSPCHYWIKGDRFQYQNKVYSPQKFMWMMVFGEVPHKHVIQTTCGNNNCVYSGHLTATLINDVYKSKLSDEDRFLSHVTKTDYCWEWNVPSGEGYGFFYVSNKKVKAHRFSYQLYKEQIPEGMLVCHKCDNPRCVNPDHLFLGTGSDNQQDCVKKGRANRNKGEDAYNSKLTESDIRVIRWMRDLGWTLESIGKSFGIKFQYVSKICRRQVWKHIP